MASNKYVKIFFKPSTCIVCNPAFCCGVESPTTFSKKGPDRMPIFRG